MDNIKREPFPASQFHEYFIDCSQGYNPVFEPMLAGITFPSPKYEIFRSTQLKFYVFEYIIEGRGTVIEDGRTIYPKAGDVYILHPEKNQHYYSDKNDPLKKIWLNVGGSIVGELLKIYRLSDVFLIPDFRNADYLFQILQAAESNENVNEKILLLLHEFISELSKFSLMISQSVNPAYKLKDYILKNIETNITLTDLSELIHHSKSRTIQIFQKEFGTTPYVYIMNVKVQTAKTYLEKTSLSVKSIAEKLAFTNPHNFSSFFKKITGTTPKEYRNIAKSKIQ